ncbi:hydrogenase expression/formation protein HypE [Kitasatospora sp. NPDC097643]|uniref:hydrogenase expression/formation protein HypE n=1 Tax=Kitasatospora sp. NPDC097643 TaxID=3157230 RepID=UPI003326DDAA
MTALECPLPIEEGEVVLLGHGAGGRLSAELLEDLLLPAISGSSGRGLIGRVPLEDAAVLPATGGAELVVSTDSFVVSPLFFPGGDIGSLSVHGTINDVAMMGAMPTALTVSLIIEEGLPLATLERVARSLGEAARAAGVAVVTGDTKVVNRGAADQLFITTTGLGTRLPGTRTSAAYAAPGDVVLLSGPIGLHGTTVLSTREGLGFESDIATDSRPLHHLVRAIAKAGGSAVHVLRDPTRGGLATTLNEIARDSAVTVEIDEAAIPVPEAVAAACDLLGLDVLHVANEGCLVAFVAADKAEDVLTAMRAVPGGEGAVRIGHVADWPAGRVVMRTLVGAHRVVDMLAGEQLPRIC